MQKQSSILAAVILAGAVGCSSVTVTPLGANDATTKGLRIFQPAPYLLVTLAEEKKPAAAEKEGANKDGNDNPTTATSPVYMAKIIYLPDYSHPFAVTTKSGWGTIDTSLKLVDGWQLTELNVKADSKGPETITAATGLLEAIGVLGGVPKVVDGDSTVGAGLYKLEFDKAGELTGLHVVTRIK